MNKDLKITDKILENFNKEIVPHMKDRKEFSILLKKFLMK